MKTREKYLNQVKQAYEGLCSSYATKLSEFVDAIEMQISVDEDPAQVSSLKDTLDFVKNNHVLSAEFLGLTNDLDYGARRGRIQRIILDNGGGIILQLGKWAHYYGGYNGMYAQVAEDIATWLKDRSTDGWEGHDDDAMLLDPSLEEIENGGYNVIFLSSMRSPITVAKALVALGSNSAIKLANELKRQYREDKGKK